MNDELLDPKDITNKQAAIILLARGWTIYPYALPYGEFFYVPTKGEGYNFEVACLAYTVLWQIYKETPLLAHIPPIVNLRKD